MGRGLRICPCLDTLSVELTKLDMSFESKRRHTSEGERASEQESEDDIEEVIREHFPDMPFVFPPTEENINETIQKWKVGVTDREHVTEKVREDFKAWSNGDNWDSEERFKYYPGWTQEDFKSVVEGIEE